jgi:agmatine/peptidylarginine deiminase
VSISKYEKVLVICNDKKYVKNKLPKNPNIKLTELQTNDTWIRDYGAIDIYEEDKIISYDFTFNGWGEKYEFNLDNKVNSKLYLQGIFDNILKKEDFVLEGGSIETNGEGVLLTTKKCLLNSNRNPNFSQGEIEKKLSGYFGLKKIIWLENGGLIGDDTDSHIDTLARFLDKETICYVKCYDKMDEHFNDLNKMEKELQQTGFNLIPLPLPDPIFYNGDRLPATYANFLYINGAVILPVYNQKKDEKVIGIFRDFYPNKDIIPLDATILIREHGSIHCATMQRLVIGN